MLWRSYVISARQTPYQESRKRGPNSCSSSKSIKFTCFYPSASNKTRYHLISRCLRGVIFVNLRQALAYWIAQERENQVYRYGVCSREPAVHWDRVVDGLHPWPDSYQRQGLYSGSTCIRLQADRERPDVVGAAAT